MNYRVAGLLLLPLLGFAQSSKPSIDNERVAVWDVTWTKDQAGFAAPGDFDAVTVYLSGGDFKVAMPDGTSRVITRKTGEAIFRPRSVRSKEIWVGADATPPHTAEIELKDRAVAPVANTKGYPLAFPRPGAKKLLENERIQVWDYVWKPGVETEMHFHDKDVVISYLQGGTMKSTGADGQTVVNTNHAGVIKFNPRERTHKEVLTGGEQRGIIVELK
jgi:hypothetical protein